MSDARRLKNQGLLASLQQQRRDLESRARMYLDSIESATFFVDSPLNLNGQAVVTAAHGLKETLAEAAKVQARIDELQDELGL